MPPPWIVEIEVSSQPSLDLAAVFVSAQVRAIASLSAATQKLGVMVLETRNDRTLRLAPSRIATRYKNPCAIGKYVRSEAHTVSSFSASEREVRRR